MERITNPVYTDLVKVVFKDDTSCFVNLPHNIADADYREDVIVRWIDETFKDVKRIEIDVPRDAECEMFGIRILPTIHGAYDIFFPGMEPVYDELPDETVDWVENWLGRVNNVDSWYSQDEDEARLRNAFPENQ